MHYLVQSPAQLGDHIRAIRKARGMTQAQLGQRLGLDQTRISKIEKDPTSISVDLLFDLLIALGVRVSLAPTSLDDLKGTHPAPPNLADLDW